MRFTVRDGNSVAETDDCRQNFDLDMTYTGTIDGIFEQFAYVLETGIEGTNSYRCDGYIVPIVEYDPELGYPLSWEYDVTGNPDFDFSTVSLEEQICTDLGIGHDGFHIDRRTIDLVEPL